MLQEPGHDRDGPLPAFGFSRELLFSSTRDLVKPRPAVVLARAPLARDPALLLEPEQRRINRALVQGEGSLRHLFDAARDAVAVERAHHVEGLEHHQVERAVGNVGVRSHMCHLNWGIWLFGYLGYWRRACVP